MSLPVLHLDEHLVVVDKPAGLWVTRPEGLAAGRDSCVSRLKRALKRTVYPCQRLDRGASGALLLSFSPTPAILVEETFWALTRGFAATEPKIIDSPLDDQPCQTRFRALQHFALPYQVGKYPTARYSLLKVHPLTVHLHQMRRHLKRAGHPVAGDTRHGDAVHNHWLKQLLDWQRLALACVEIRFRHPLTHEITRLGCPLAWDFEALIERLRILE